MALEVELQHTKQTLQQQADSDKSKLEHELRLAQQEAKRWKLLAQQQQQKGRSIVGFSETLPSLENTTTSTSISTSTFSNHLLGDPLDVRPSLSLVGKPISGTRSHEEDLTIDAPEGNLLTQPQKVLAENTLSPRYHNLSQPRRLEQKNSPVSRLARNLLEQLGPFNANARYSKTKTPNTNQGQTSKDIRGPNSTLLPLDMEEGDGGGFKCENNNDDASIRRVLFSIASADSENIDTDLFRHNNTWQQPKLTHPITWTEGKLVEWLVVTFPSKSSDRYWSMLLLQSPEARKHVTENVCLDSVPSVSAYQDLQKQHHHNNSVGHQKSGRRRRRNRIRPATSEDDSENYATKLDKWQNLVRNSLHNPWWNPNDIVSKNEIDHKHNANGASKHTTTSKSMSSPQRVSCLAFREWVASLAASWNIRHLHTLRVLLAEEAGRKDLAIDASGHDSAAWWSLCYPSTAFTIHWIVYGKLIRSKKKREKREFATAKVAGNRSNSNPRNASGASDSRRYRTGMLQDRLELLQNLREKGRMTTTAFGSVEKLPGIFPDTREGKTVFGAKNIEEEEEDQVLAYSLCVWIGLLKVATPEQLEAWYGNQTGIGVAKSDKKEQLHNSWKQRFLDATDGGLFMVSILLDLLEELQFDHWVSEDDSMNPMSLSFLLSTGVLSDRKEEEKTKQKGKNNAHSASGKETQRGYDDDVSGTSTQSSSNILPQWYDTVIAVLTQVGKTRGGMRILRSRMMDYSQSDCMGNALDVSIRQLHTLALHLDDVRTRHGSILRFVENTGGIDDDSNSDNDIFWGGDPLMAGLLRSVEAWVRLWHQILLFTISTENTSFRTLVLNLQGWFTSACATLLASEEVRREIKEMIQWQLDELTMDEEDYDDEGDYKDTSVRNNS